MSKKTLILEILFWSVWFLLYLVFAGLCLFGGIMALMYIPNKFVHTCLFILSIVFSIVCCGPILFACGQIVRKIRKYVKYRRAHEKR